MSCPLGVRRSPKTDMPDLADLYPGFAAHWIDTSIGKMFARSGGEGPPFLVQPYPLPEMLISKAPVEYLDWKMASWTKAKDLSAFDPRALAHYRIAFQDPTRIHASCEDYRAGRGADLAHDEQDRAAGKK